MCPLLFDHDVSSYISLEVIPIRLCYEIFLDMGSKAAPIIGSHDSDHKLHAPCIGTTSSTVQQTPCLSMSGGDLAGTLGQLRSSSLCASLSHIQSLNFFVTSYSSACLTCDLCHSTALIR